MHVAQCKQRLLPKQTHKAFGGTPQWIGALHVESFHSIRRIRKEKGPQNLCLLCQTTLIWWSASRLCLISTGFTTNLTVPPPMWLLANPEMRFQRRVRLQQIIHASATCLSSNTFFLLPKRPVICLNCGQLLISELLLPPCLKWLTLLHVRPWCRDVQHDQQCIEWWVISM